MSPKKTIWGLYNRIFPTKIGLRVIAKLTEEANDAFVELHKVQEEAGKQARFIGKELADYDETSGRPLGEKFSTGLPIGKQDKALSRYGAMFVGLLRSDGRAEGLPVDLGFVIVKRAERAKELVALTESGAEFVKLTNPILDRQGNVMPDYTLSEDEADFYLSHIRHWLPPEWERTQLTLTAISEGHNEPDKLDKVLRHDEKKQKSDSLSTERAGIISRLTELGLVRRRRTGLRVTYSLTNRGEQYLNKRNES
jgi:predicted transcriptional regulator